MDHQKIEPHILKRFEVLKKLGSGAYGHVWKVREPLTSRVFALKKIFDAFQHATDAQRTYREVTVLKQLEHRNIGLYELIKSQNDRDIYLLFEYMETDLHNVICEGLLQEVHKKYIVYQTLMALKYLHSAELMHRDLKPSNLLLNSDCLAKLCDFGLVRYVGQGQEENLMTEGVATRWYRAPEVLLGSKDYDWRADMWSLGCIVAEIYLRKPLLPGTSILNQVERILTITGRPSPADINSVRSDQARNIVDQIKTIKTKEIKQIFGSGSELLADFVSKLLQWNPVKRMSAGEALHHPFLVDFVNKQDQVEFKGKIKFEVSDNHKLSTDGYKKLVYALAQEGSFQSPKKFSDLRKNSANKQSKNNSKNNSNAAKGPQKPMQRQQTPETTTKTTATVSPRNLFHRPATKANSPNSFKDIILQQEKENRQMNGQTTNSTFAGKLGEILKPEKRGTIGDGLSPKSPIKASETMKHTFSKLVKYK